MIWRHLFEEEAASLPFVHEQLAFERAVYAKMEECQREEVLKQHGYSRCAQEMERRIDKFALLLQYLVSDREKVLEKELESCKEGAVVPCVDQKSRAFIARYYRQDLRFLEVARQQLLQ